MYIFFKISFFYLNFFECLFILREREHVQGRSREKGRESQAGSELSAQSLMQGPISWTGKSWPERKPWVRCLTHWAATQAPRKYIFKVRRGPQQWAQRTKSLVSSNRHSSGKIDSKYVTWNWVVINAMQKSVAVGGCQWRAAPPEMEGGCSGRGSNDCVQIWGGVSPAEGTAEANARR